jgi:hypothetical protein
MLDSQVPNSSVVLLIKFTFHGIGYWKFPKKSNIDIWYLIKGGSLKTTSLTLQNTTFLGYRHLINSTSRDPLTMAPPSQTSISGIAMTAIKGLSLLRIFTGAACIFAPRFICSLHGSNLPREHNLLVRMMGIREGVVGGLLWTAVNGDLGGSGGVKYVSLVWIEEYLVT